jgi:thioredoxin-related protein
MKHPFHTLSAILLLLVLSGSLFQTATADGLSPPVKIPEALDLATDGKRAEAGGMPILLLVSQEECPFCMQIKRDILHPMILSGEYEGRLLIREVFIDPGHSVKDFTGKLIEGDNFALRYGVTLTPTLLFLDPKGRELTKRIIGIQTPEMFFFYVDAAVSEAIDALHRNKG